MTRTMKGGTDRPLVEVLEGQIRCMGDMERSSRGRPVLFVSMGKREVVINVGGDDKTCRDRLSKGRFVVTLLFIFLLLCFKCTWYLFCIFTF